MLRSFLNRVKGRIWSSIDRTELDMASGAKVRKEAEKIVWIRHSEHERIMKGKFCYQFPNIDDSIKQREFHFNRLIAEPNSEALMRLQCNIQKYTIRARTKGQKKKLAAVGEAELDDSISISLFDENGVEIEGSIPNTQAWTNGGILQIGDVKYTIRLNTPTVLNIALPYVILCDGPLLPYLTMEFTQSADFRWVRVGNTDVTVSHDKIYTPTPQDIGHYLKLFVHPKRGNFQGKPEVIQSSSTVVQAPELLPVLSRETFTTEDTSPNNFRVVSYNILAELYSDSDFSREELFAHCPADYLHYDYRKPLIAKELLAYNADVVCLQEMDSKHFTNYYQPLLASHGYESSMYSKRHYVLPDGWDSAESLSTSGGSLEEEQESGKPTECENSSDNVEVSSEGSAIVFKGSKFRQIADCSISIAETLENDIEYSDLKETALNCRLALEKLLYRSGSSVQVIVLESVDDVTKRLCVANSHLYFHPQAAVVRLLQASVAMRHLQHVKSTYETETSNVSILFCGDFNSHPNSQIVQLIRSRRISKTDKVWSDSSLYAMQGMDLNHQLNVESACGYPKYTNYVPAFKECIDYIFYEKDKLFVESVAPLPSDDFMIAHGDGIPSQHFPSDHLALCCEISWK